MALATIDWVVEVEEEASSLAEAHASRTCKDKKIGLEVKVLLNYIHFKIIICNHVVFEAIHI